MSGLRHDTDTAQVLEDLGAALAFLDGLACSPLWGSGAAVVRRHVERARAALAQREAEVQRLQGLVNGLADRVAGQSELLARRAERQPGEGTSRQPAAS